LPRFCRRAIVLHRGQRIFAAADQGRGKNSIDLLLRSGILPFVGLIHAAAAVDELIEKADGFAGVFPEHKYEIVRQLQERKHICGRPR